jgi:hypothetical protein
MAWFGSALSGTWVGDRSKMTIIRQFDQVPESMTLVHGTSPVITNVSVTPPMFGPAAVPSPASAQVFTLTLTRYASRPVTVTAVFRNLEYGSILRTVTSAAQNSDVVTLSWDGRADNGERAAPGRYEVLLTVTDSVGSTATIKPLMVVRY